MENFIKALITEAGKIAAEKSDKSIWVREKTSKADLVTAADLWVSEFCVENIRNNFPEHHIVSEELESEINSGHEYKWVIDPIDGTRNFANGIVNWCTMIALLQNDDVIFNAVYQPITNELYFAEKNKGATKNGEKICVNDVNTMDKALGILCCDSKGVELETFRKGMHKYVESNGWLHNHGTMLSACHVASGGIDFLVNNYGYPHDYLPIVLICREAGATITTVHGGDWNSEHRDIIIANPFLHSQVLELFN